MSQRGNRRKCRKCNHLAGKDGYCKHHRPERAPINRFRSNFIDELRGFTRPEEREDFGVMGDFKIIGRWG